MQAIVSGRSASSRIALTSSSRSVVQILPKSLHLGTDSPLSIRQKVKGKKGTTSTFAFCFLPFIFFSAPSLHSSQGVCQDFSPTQRNNGIDQRKAIIARTPRLVSDGGMKFTDCILLDPGILR